MQKVALVAAVFVAAAFFIVGDKTAHAQTADNAEQKPKIVVVEPGDSLSKIANQNETTYPRLFYANENITNPDLIYPGDELRIPRPDEQLTERPLPGSAPAPTPQSTRPTATGQPAPQEETAPVQSSAGSDVWDRLAMCESGGNWQINTGNGYYGGLQFSLGTWQSVGGTGYPHQASKSEQIARAQALQTRSGWGQWPACSAKLGLR